MGGNKQGPMIPHKEALQRMNFLYQASYCLERIADDLNSKNQRTKGSDISVSQSESGHENHEPVSPKTCLLRNRQGTTGSLKNLSQYYAHEMMTVAKRLVLRVDPRVKRSLCKRCRTLLVPSISAKIRKRSGKHHQNDRIVASCLTCGFHRSFRLNDSHQLFAEKMDTEADYSSTMFSSTQYKSTSLLAQQGPAASDVDIQKSNKNFNV